MLAELTKNVECRQNLSTDQVQAAVNALTDEAIAPTIKAAFLSALAQKGETVGEIAAFAVALRELSVPVPIEAGFRDRPILDVVGTGGDRLNTINISSTAAIVCAAAGVAVAKHGNRAVTSQSGSADVLEALGIRVDCSPAEAVMSLRDHGFAFLFAPKYHPAFRHIGPARKLCAERGQRTIFNYLGPLLNPARPSAQLIGVPRPELCAPMAQVLQMLGVRRGMVVCGAAGEAFLDELSTIGETTVAEFYHNHALSSGGFDARTLPLQPAVLADLVGGDKETNAMIARNILTGTERGPKRDAVLLNAGAALFVAGRSRSITEGWELAAAVVDDGRAAAKLKQLAGR